MKLMAAIPLLASAFSISNALQQELTGKCGRSFCKVLISFHCNLTPYHNYS
jgi:hypothetical protein